MSLRGVALKRHDDTGTAHDGAIMQVSNLLFDG
jgi:hypothetical protein